MEDTMHALFSVLTERLLSDTVNVVLKAMLGGNYRFEDHNIINNNSSFILYFKASSCEKRAFVEYVTRDNERCGVERFIYGLEMAADSIHDPGGAPHALTQCPNGFGRVTRHFGLWFHRQQPIYALIFPKSPHPTTTIPLPRCLSAYLIVSLFRYYYQHAYYYRPSTLPLFHSRTHSFRRPLPFGIVFLLCSHAGPRRHWHAHRKSIHTGHHCRCCRRQEPQETLVVTDMYETPFPSLDLPPILAVVLATDFSILGQRRRISGQRLDY